MYISQIVLDTRKRDTARALYNREILHGALENCFIGERQHPLWRLDISGGRTSILMVSKDIPELTSFVSQFGDIMYPAQTKPYDVFLESIVKENSLLRFRTTINPTIKKNGKRVPLNANRTENQPYCASDWLNDRLSVNGAKLVKCILTRYDLHKIHANEKKTVTLVSAEYDGYLRVKDVAGFRHILTDGLGHGKAYGCGLVSVMRAL